MIPLIAFFTAYYITKNIYTATLVCIIASWFQLVLTKITTKKISKNIWISTLLVTILGSMTILLHNKTFIMMKPTILYWVFAIGLFISAKIGKNPMQLLMQEQISLDHKSWAQINLLWIVFFIIMGILNIIIAINFDEYIWVKFKVFGSLILMVLFTVITGFIIYKKTKGNLNGLQ